MGCCDLTNFCDAASARTVSCNSCSCACGVRIVLQAVLLGLGGEELHVDQFVEHLILLVGGQLLLLALQQVLHVNVEFGARDGLMPLTAATGGGRGAAGCGAGCLLCLVAGRQRGEGRHGGHRDQRAVEIALIWFLYAKKRLWPTWPMRPGAAV